MDHCGQERQHNRRSGFRPEDLWSFTIYLYREMIFKYDFDLRYDLHLYNYERPSLKGHNDIEVTK